MDKATHNKKEIKAIKKTCKKMDLTTIILVMILKML